MMHVPLPDNPPKIQAPFDPSAPPKDGLDPYRRIRGQLYMPRSYNEIMNIEPSKPYTTLPPDGVTTTSSTTTSTVESMTDPPDVGSGFTQVAHQAISRALFCNNPDYNPTVNPVGSLDMLKMIIRFPPRFLSNLLFPPPRNNATPLVSRSVLIVIFTTVRSTVS